MSEPTRGEFRLEDLRLVGGCSEVEYVGGPDDGRKLPLTLSALRPNGYYVPVNVGNIAVAMRYVPFVPPSSPGGTTP